MIEIIVIAIALMFLAFIYFHRWQVQTKANIFGRMGFKKGMMMPPKMTKDDHEVTVKEMLPDANTIDPKLAIKAEMLFKKAELALKKNDFKEAEKLYIQTISLSQAHLEAHAKLGRLYLSQNQDSKAELMYRKLVVSVPNEAMYFSNLGLALFNQERLQEAKDAYLRAVELDDKRAGRFFSLARVEHALGNREEAFKNIHKALELDGENLDYALTLANWYLEAEMKEEAETLIKAILAFDENNESALELWKEINDEKKYETDSIDQPKSD